MRQTVLIFLLGMAPAAGFAADAQNTDNLEQVVVSATKSAEDRELTGASVSVISAADIAVQHLDFVSDALAETPDLTVVRNGGPGQTTSIGLRGAEAAQTLVLVDGTRIMDPSAPDGSAILSDLLVNSIERIEVLRGPQSTLYGSDAIGGVVNILTRRGGNTPLALTAAGEGGSFGSFRLGASANGTASGVEYGAGINLYTTEGIAAADTRPVRDQTDPYRNLGATANVRVPVADNISADARVWYVSARTVFDGFPPPNYTLQYDGEYGTDSLLALYGGINADFLGGRFRNRIAVSDFGSSRTNYDPGLNFAEDFTAKGHATEVEYQGIFDVTPWSVLTFGADSLHTSLRTASPAPGDTNPAPLTGSRQLTSGYAQLQATLLDQLTLTGGVRHDADSAYGGHNSLKAAAALALFGGATVLRGDYGDGFKAPSLYEIYSPYSNPVQKLAPEMARGWEAGLDQHVLDGDGLVSVVYFQRHTDDQIDFFGCYGINSAACAQRPFGYYANILKSRAQGVEVEAGAQLFQTFHLYGNLTDMDAEDATTGYELARRPRLMANGRLVWTPDAQWSAGISASFTGKRFNDAYESTPLGAFTLVDVFASYAVTPGWQIYVRGANLLDQHYETAAGYHAMPLSFLAGFQFSV